MLVRWLTIACVYAALACALAQLPPFIPPVSLPPEYYPNMTACENDILQLLSGSYPNAASMLLASGKGPTETGNYDMCQDLDNAHYCMFVYQIPAIIEGIDFKTGLCVPLSCSEEDLASVGNLTQQLLPALQNVKGVDVYCALKTMKPISQDWKAIVVVCLLCFFVFLGIVGGFTEWLHIRNRKKKQPHINMGGLNGDEAPSASINDDVMERPKKPSLIVAILLAFSPISNLKKLVQPTTVPHLASLNGLRAFSMLWVLLGHTVFWAFFTTGFDNMSHVMERVVPTFFANVILNATLSVDSFFYMSGFLVAYLGMKELWKKGRINLFLFYFHRLYRLTPPYFVALLVLWKLLPYFNQGPFWKLVDSYVSRTSCDKYWWTNLLYINNFYPPGYNDQCMGWSWYLANDWQMYLISPIFLYVYYKSRRAGIILIDICLMASLTANAIVAYVNDFSAYVPDMTSNTVYQDWVYEKFYMRIPVYFVGMLAAFVLLEVEKRGRNRLPWYWLCVMYIISGLLIYFPVFGSLSLNQSRGGWNRVQMLSYIVFTRLSFATGIAFLMHTFFLGHGYLLRKVFEWHIWAVIARLTFSTYLYHPILMSVVFFGATSFFHYNAVNVTVHFFGFIVGSLVVATASFLLIERPLMNLEKIFLH